MKQSTILRTAAEIALARTAVVARQLARQQREETKRAEWRRRLDPAAYSCTRDGGTWIAEGPAGQRFVFSKDGDGQTVVCRSHTGRDYYLTMQDGARRCDCPTPAEKRTDGCKHETAFRAVCQAASMQRQMAEKPAPQPPAAIDLDEIERTDRSEVATAEAEYARAIEAQDTPAIERAASDLQHAYSRARITAMARELSGRRATA